MKKRDHIKMHSYPGMVAVVGVHTEEGANFMSAGWHAYLSMDPPMYGVAVGRERYTYDQLKKAGRFSINFLPFGQAEHIQYNGSLSGFQTDKGKTQKWFLTDSSVPMLEEAYLGYECELSSMVPTGDHDWVIGNIELCYYKEGLFGEDGLPDFSQVSIPLYLGRSTYMKLDDSVKKTQIHIPKDDKKS
ncbi:flavin reductase family protein [Halobacillus litoralis]|uniref:flavin reductase family protein n=1 Tax=Halobacillus litoralis TaxID=45668 RepID=UPI001CD449E6|nr:flavin reductase family protein [Halobacillus litoralis]MCA0970033.1 flavin reductase family protein [Halobacillus litoralis]